MMIEFKLPDIGEGIAEAEIVSWLVGEGESVKEDQSIVTIETDKAIAELPSPATGVVERLAVQEGQVVPIGTVLITIRVDDWDVSAAPAAPLLTTAAGHERPPPRDDQLAERRHVKTTPVVRRLAAELGVDLAVVAGSGPDGRITREDVERYADGTDRAAQPSIGASERSRPPPEAGERVPLRGLRREIARSHARDVAVDPAYNRFPGSRCEPADPATGRFEPTVW